MYEAKVEEMRDEKDSLARTLIKYNQEIDMWRNKVTEITRENVLP